MAIILLEKLADGTVNRIKLGREKIVVKAQRGAHYEVINEKGDKAPDDLVVIRAHEDLIVQVDGEVRVEIDDFFREATPDEMAYYDIHEADGDLVTLTEESSPIATIGDNHLLYALEDRGGGGIGWLPLGLLGLGAAAGAVALGGGSKKDKPEPAGPAKLTAKLDSSSDTGAQGDGITNDTTPTLSGTGEPGTTIKVAWPNGTSSSVPVGPDGKWSATPTTPLAAGTHDIPVTQTDSAGKVSPATPVKLTIDAAAPTAPVAKLDSSSDTGTQGDGITNDTTPTLSGTGDPGATIKVAWPNGTSSSVLVGPDGKWSATPTTPLAAGTHDIPVTQTDPAGNVSPATPVKLTIDAAAPTAPVAKLDPLSDTGTLGDNITSDTTPTLSGTGELGATIKVAWPNGTSSSVPVGADGKWSATPTTPLALGAHNIPVTQTDPAGNVSPATPVPVTINAMAGPVAKLDSSSDTGTQGDGITSDTTPTLSGEGQPGATIKVAWPNGTSSSVPVGPDGKWSATPTTPLAPGAHTIPVTQTDPAGNVSPATPVRVTIDAAAPLAPTAKLDPSSDSGTPGDGITSDTTPTLSGEGEPGATIKVAWPDGTTSSVPVGTNGTWTATPTTPLTPGGHDIPVTQTDPAGNVSPATPVRVTIDAAAPLAPTAALDLSSDTGTLGDNITSDTTPTLSGTGELGATIKVAWPNGTSSSVPVGADGTWSATPTTPLAAGAHTIPVTQTDPAGNVSPAIPVPVTINSMAGPLAPTAKLDSSSDSGTPGDGITSDPTPTLSGEGQPGATVKVAWPDGTSSSVPVGPDGRWTATPTTPFTPGGHDIRVTQTDPAGNVSPVTPVRVTVDAAAPLAPTAKLDPSSDSGTPGDGITSDTTPTLSGEGEPGATIKVAWPDGTTSSVPVGTNGTWTATPTTPLTPGGHDIPVTQTDPAGNVSPATPVRVTIDAAAPLAPTAALDPLSDSGTLGDNITSDTTPTLSGTGELGATIKVAWPNGTSSSVPVGTDGKWSATPTTPLAPGAHTIPVTQTDPAGNVSPAIPVPVTIDTAAPAAPTAQLDPSSDTGTPGDGITSDTTPTLSGEGQPGATIKVAWPDGTSSSVPVGTNGRWAATPTTPLTPGGHDIPVTQTDPAGNVSPATPVRVTIETAAPLAPTAKLDPSSDTGTPGDGITSDTTPTLSGEGRPGATVKVAWPDGTTSSVPVGPNGTWTATPTTPLTPGGHDIPVTQTDPAGNVSPATPVRVTIDAAAPLAPTAALDPLSDTGTLGDNITSDTTPTLSGTGELGATIKVAWPNGTSSSVPVGTDGKWSATPTTPLAPGAHTIPVTQTDPAGNVSPAIPVPVTIDTAAPAAPTAQLDPSSDTGTPGDGITSDTTPTLSGSGVPGATVKVAWPDGTSSSVPVGTNGTWTATPTTPLTPGGHDIPVTQTDPAGNVSPATPVRVTIDTTVPNAPPVDGNETPSATEDTPFTPINLLANATDPNGDALTVTVDSITGNTAGAVSVTNGMLAVNTDDPDLDSLAAGQTQVVTVNYTVSDGKGGTDASTATVTINGVNDAPVLASTTATSSAVLFAGEPITKLSYAPIERTTGGMRTVANGWQIASVTPDIWVNNGPQIEGGTSFTLGDVNGNSLNNAGTDDAIMGLGAASGAQHHESALTTLNNLVVGQKYAVAFQWQEANLLHSDGNTQRADGRVIARINTTIPTVVTYSEPLAPGQDTWKTEVLFFTATATTHSFSLDADMSHLPAGQSSYVVIDSLNASQFTVPSTSTGAAASAVFGGSSDVDSGATLKGYAVTSAAAAGTGHWQYSSDGGTTWINLDSASVTGAILLAPTDLVHWTGAPGTNTALSARAVDNTSSAALHSAVDVTVNGGTTPYSANVSTLAANSTPVVLDLNGDGAISYTTAQFDIDGNGVADSTAWVGGGDGILFWDKQGDGQLHGQDQYAFGKAVKGTDLEGLAALFDSNKDGMFDALDTAFGQFKVWKDTDQNGQVGDGELIGLADAGITGIQLTSDRNAFDPAPGVHAFGKGSALLADGSTMLLHDASFEYRPLG